jgi:hypothetical protein
MKTICVVQGGKFLLGIDAARILARTAWAELAPQRKKDEKIFHLAALLDRRPGGTVSPDAVCLELQGNDSRFLLVVDKIADEAETINPPSPLPPACPRLAARLCPQVTTWGDMPVLLLDPAQVIPVAIELGKGIGLLTEEPEVEMTESEPHEEDDPFFPEEKPVPVLFVPEEDSVEPEGPLAFLANAEEDVPAACSFDKEELVAETKSEEETETEPEESAVETKSQCAEAGPDDVDAEPESSGKESSTIDEETFKKVMSWTITRFKQSRAGEELHLGTNQLPPELAGMVEEKGLSRSIIQYLIDQIVLRCKETESAGRRLPGETHAH